MTIMAEQMRLKQEHDLMRQEQEQRSRGAGGEATRGGGKGAAAVHRREASEARSDLNLTRGNMSLHAKAAMTSVVGSVRWMAPEMISHSLATPYNKKVDVYSFGIVMWELQNRRMPYNHLRKPVEIFRAVVSGRAPRIS
jgi:serine/threonine protein kinase